MVADGWMEVALGMGVWGCPMHAHMHMHVKYAKHAKHGCLHAGNHLQFYTCVCVCVCVCILCGLTVLILVLGLIGQ